MTKQLSIKTVISMIISAMHDARYHETYIINEKRSLLKFYKFSVKKHHNYFNEKIATEYIASLNKYHNELIKGKRSICKIKSFIANGLYKYSSGKMYRHKNADFLPSSFKKSIIIYDKHEQERGLSQSSLIKNRRVVLYLFEYLYSFGITRISHIKAGDTVHAFECMLKEHYTPKGLTTALSGIRRLYNEYIPFLKKLKNEIPKRLKRPRKIINVLSDEAINRILKLIASDKFTFREKAIIMLSLATGLRETDIRNLKLKNINWDKGVITIMQHKTGVELSIPIKASFGNYLVQYLLKERPKSKLEYVFLTPSAPHRKYTYFAGVYNKFSKLMSHEFYIGSRILRHSFASYLVRHDTKIDIISLAMGHSSLDSTMIYISTDNKRMAELTLPLPF